MRGVRVRAKVPERVRAGEIVEVRTLASHRMESGERIDAEGRRIPRDIVHRFEARLDGRLAFAADFGPAVSANPYLAFRLRVERSATLELAWTDDAGETTRLERRIEVDG